MDCASRKPRVWLAAVAASLAAFAPAAAGDEADHMALLNRTRAQVVASLRHLPKYTCVQTVRRFRFQTGAHAKLQGCGGAADLDALPLALYWSDRARLDVTVSQGEEIFSWAGARKFETGPIDKIVGGGMTGTGDFGPFLMSVFTGAAAPRTGIPAPNRTRLTRSPSTVIASPCRPAITT